MTTGDIEITKPTTRTVEVRAPYDEAPITMYKQGPPGPRGPSGVVVGDTPPDDTTLIWVDTSA